MGQCYTVETNLKFKNNDPSEFCAIIREEVANRNGKSAFFSPELGAMDTPFECFKILTSRNAHEWEDGVYSADFDGSYGWELVMIEVFKASAKGLANGSVITIYPDSGKDTIRVKKGEVVVTG